MKTWTASAWTTAEEQLLREYYRRIGPAACAEMLERPVTAVRHRAHRLGVTERDPRKAQRFHYGQRSTPAPAPVKKPSRDQFGRIKEKK